MVNDKHIYFETHGTSGPYLLMVHGFLSSKSQWSPNLDYLSRFCRPVVVDLFGHGRSPTPADNACYHPDNYIEEFERIRKELGCEKWYVCGQSLGASLTFHYVLKYPEYIKGHIFTNSRSALAKVSFEERARALINVVEKRGHQAIVEMPIHPSKGRYLKPEIRNMLIEEARLVSVEGIVKTALNLLANAPVRDRLHKNSIRTLLIAGQLEKTFQPFLKEVDALIPHLEVELLDGGHSINLEAPESFDRCVERFISG